VAHPQTGSSLEAGLGAGVGHNVNIELGFGSGDGAYVDAMERVVAPIVDAYRPQLVMVACGQDANQFDPNGRQCLSMAGFRRLGEISRDLADRHCDGRLVMIQEGGYARSYSALCMHATLEGVLRTGKLLADPMAFLPDDAGRGEPGILAAIGSMRRYWPI
jgi:acetoin utilization deacetylase AcuC-like enzyme